MLGIPVRYLLKHPVTGVADLLADPVETWTTVHDAYVAKRERRRPQCPYDPDPNWEQKLHEALNVPWPCDETSEFSELWREVISELEAKGIRAGPESFQWWNDGDAGLVRAIWCLTRHLRPRKVVETGVAHGVTSRFILEALKRNGQGHLWSIDLPPLERSWRQEVGVAVGDGHLDRWTYIKGSSRRRLPGLLLTSVKLTFSFTIAFIVSVTFCLSWIELGQSWGRRAQSLWTTSTPIGASAPLLRTLPVRFL